MFAVFTSKGQGHAQDRPGANTDMLPQQPPPRSDDEADLSAFLQRYQKPLFAVLLRLLRNTDDAEDALAAGVFKVWQARQAFRGEASFKNWAFRIVRNTGLDLLAKRAPHSTGRVVWDDAENEIEDTAVPGSPACLCDVLVGREQATQVRNALARLPDEYRVAVALHYLENKSYKEIEEITGVPQTTLKPRLSRALKMLRRELADLMEEDEHPEPTTPPRPRRQIVL